jgi:hypothetical protein
VCAAAGLPDPHVPGRRRRDRAAPPPGGRRRRHRNWPWTHTSGDTSVHAVEYGLSVRFAGGYPEEVRFLNFDAPEGGPELVHRWGDAMPLVRLTFAFHLTPAAWGRVAGPHLDRLSELTLDYLPTETAPLVAASPHLSALTRLSVNVIGANADAVRALVVSPAWAGLRSLAFTGRMSPDAVRDLALFCTLEHVEELSLGLGNPADPGNPFVGVLNDLLRALSALMAFSANPPVPWPDFGPALEALAAAPWVRRLRKLHLASGSPAGFLTLLGQQLHGGAEADANRIPDAAVLALASALNPDKLETLTLPAAVVGPSVREELTTRLGPKVRFE